MEKLPLRTKMKGRSPLLTPPDRRAITWVDTRPGVHQLLLQPVQGPSPRGALLHGGQASRRWAVVESSAGIVMG